MKKVVVVGTGGHAKVIVDIIEKESKFKMMGFIESSLDVGTKILDYEVLGREEDLSHLAQKKSIFGGVIAIGDNVIRAKVEKKINRIYSDFNFINCIHPKSIIAKDVCLGVGNVVMAGVIINPSSTIGNHCILNTNSSLDHDSSMLDFTSIAPNVVTGGNVKINEYSAIGIGATIFQGVSIGSNCLVGGGSLISKDTQSNSIYYGNPAKYIREHKLGETSS